MRLTIESQPAKLGMNTQNASVQRQSTLPRIDLETEQAKVEMTSTQPKIQIDQRQCFSESGLKGILELSAENAANAVSTMYASVGRIAEQGNALTDIQNGGNPIAEQAYYNAYDQFATDYNMVTMPKTRPKITLQEGRVNLNVRGGTVNENYVKGEIKTEYQAGKVEIYMLQERMFQMRFEQSQFDQKG